MSESQPETKGGKIDGRTLLMVALTVLVSQWTVDFLSGPRDSAVLETKLAAMQADLSEIKREVKGAPTQGDVEAIRDNLAELKSRIKEDGERFEDWMRRLRDDLTDLERRFAAASGNP